MTISIATGTQLAVASTYGASVAMSALTNAAAAVATLAAGHGVVVGDFLERSLALQAGVKQLNEQEATTKLRETWKTDAEFSEGVQRAFKAGQAYAGEDFEGILSDYGNDPRIVRLLANVGKELGEDTSAPAGAQAAFTADLETLTKSKAYFDANHPEHLATKQKVEQLMQRQHGTGPKRNGPIVITTG